MTFWMLVRRNLRFHARAHLGVVLGAAIGSAALIGALVVGDSVRESLTGMALRRLGKLDFALATQDRLFQTTLRQRLCATRPPDSILAGSTTLASIYPFSASLQSSALALPGIAARQDGAARANRVNVIGVVVGSWPRLANWGKLSPGAWLPGPKAASDRQSREEQPSPEGWLSGPERESINNDGVSMMLRERGNGPLTRWKSGETTFINQTLARQLAAREGDEIILRVRKPSALGLDAAISPRNEDTVAVRLKIGAVLTPELLGDFALTAQPSPPANLFLPLGFLSDKLGVPDQANLLVAGPILAKPQPRRWDGLRTQVMRWLWMHAPLGPARSAGPAGVIRHADRSSLAVRAARSLEPKREYPIPDKLALPWLNRELALAWLPEDVGLSVHAVEQPASATGGDYIRPAAEVTSSRIFLEPSVVAAVLKPRTVALTNRPAFEGDGPNDVAFAQFVTNGVRVLTYLANLIRAHRW
jgi:hypothetical protein